MALVPCLTKHVLRENQDYVPGESEYPCTPATALCPWFCPVTGQELWTSGWACVYLPPTQRSPPWVPPLLGVGRSLGLRGGGPRGGGDQQCGLGPGTPMLEDVDEGGIRPWHLVKPSEEPEPPRPRRGSLRGGERERAKAIPEIYLTRLLSMKVGVGLGVAWGSHGPPAPSLRPGLKPPRRPPLCAPVPPQGTLQKFVDDLFQVILSTSRPVPLAIKYFFDLLDEQAQQHGISDQETVHIWKTNRCGWGPPGQGHGASSPGPPCRVLTGHACPARSLPLRFWVNIIKNPQFVFDVQTSDNMDAVLLVIAQTFMDACTLADHKLGRVSGWGTPRPCVGRAAWAQDVHTGPRLRRVRRGRGEVSAARPWARLCPSDPWGAAVPTSSGTGRGRRVLIHGVKAWERVQPPGVGWAGGQGRP